MTIGEREYERHRQTTPNGKLAESYFDLAGVRGPVCEVIDAMAEDNDRLRRELEEAKAERDEIKADLAAAGALLSPADPHVSLPEAIADLQAELACMRPVVEAVVEYVSSGMRERWPVLRAVEAYLAGAGEGDE